MSTIFGAEASMKSSHLSGENFVGSAGKSHYPLPTSLRHHVDSAFATFRSSRGLWRSLAAAASLAAIFIAIPALGQSSSAAISGTVTDATGAKIPGGDVFLVNTDTRAVQQTKTSSTGTYSIIDIRPGNYKVRAAKSNFGTV